MKLNRRNLKNEGRKFELDKEITDKQAVLEVGNEAPQKATVGKDDKDDFEAYKQLYMNSIKNKCLAEYGTDCDDKLIEDTAKEMFLKAVNYVPTEETKSDGELGKKTESKETNPYKVEYKAMLNGKEVKKGDIIKDFRGDECEFVGITNPGTPFGGIHGKVQVKSGDSVMEYYPSVFKIEIVKAEDDNVKTESKKLTESTNYLFGTMASIFTSLIAVERCFDELSDYVDVDGLTKFMSDKIKEEFTPAEFLAELVENSTQLNLSNGEDIITVFDGLGIELPNSDEITDVLVRYGAEYLADDLGVEIKEESKSLRRSAKKTETKECPKQG